MASPRRARSLLLSPDKAELLAAKEVNNLVHRVQVLPSRKPVPRQGRRTDSGIDPRVGDENRVSSTSTISTVDAFCREYRPPSVALHRLSYLNKELPLPPPSEVSEKTLSQEKAVSRASTQRHAASQTVISIQSRYSTHYKPTTRSRLSTISSQQSNSEDRVSIRSQFSTQDYAIGQDVTRTEPRPRSAVDRRRRSVGWDLSKQDVRRRDSSSFKYGTVAHNENISAAVGGKNQDSERPEVDTQGFQDVQDPLTSTESKDVVLRSKSKSKTSVAWTFSDGLSLRTEDKIGSAAAMSSEGESLVLQPTLKPMIPIRWTFSDGLILTTVDKSKDPTATTSGDENLALERRPKAMVPVRWTFHDGFIYKAIDVPRDQDGIVEAKSKRMLPIGWSFHDGLTIGPDGSVKLALKARDGGTEVARGGILPFGWSFHDGFTVRPDGSIKVAPKAADEGKEIVRGGNMSTSMLPICWSFHDGLTVRSDGSVKVASKATYGR